MVTPSTNNFFPTNQIKQFKKSPIPVETYIKSSNRDIKHKKKEKTIDLLTSSKIRVPKRPPQIQIPLDRPQIDVSARLVDGNTALFVYAELLVLGLLRFRHGIEPRQSWIGGFRRFLRCRRLPGISQRFCLGSRLTYGAEKLRYFGRDVDFREVAQFLHHFGGFRQRR